MAGETAAAVPPSEDHRLLRLSLQGRPVERPLPIESLRADTYARWLRILNATGAPYAVGGAYAVYAYTGAWRDSKDLDVFLRPRDLKTALDALRSAGFDTEVRDPLWLAKAHRPPVLMDLLFAVRHGTSLPITADWFATCRPVELMGVPTRLLGPEEVIATKVYLAARDRFDGADIAHLVRAAAGQVDWRRVVDLLHGDEDILFWHLVFFQLVYPGLVDHLPKDLMRRAFARLEAAWPRSGDPRAFRGTLFDPEMFAVDVEDWGHQDGRDLRPLVDEEGAAL
jgi:hypothetical protein